MSRCITDFAQATVDLAEMTARKDDAYLERNRCVALIARMALASGWRAGIARTAIEGWSEDWHGCVYVDLPTGQVSWHFHDSQAHLFADLPPYTGAWDGHDTPEKYRRVGAACPVAASVYEKELAPSRADLIAGLTFYATGQHRITVDDNAWDTVSGEPNHWLANEAGDMVEDGTIAAEVLAGDLTAKDLSDEDADDREAPQATPPADRAA